MTAALKSIAETVERLPAKDRILLAEHLIASLEDIDIDAQWAEESVRRRDEVRSGKVKPVPAAEVYRRIERLLAKRKHRVPPGSSAVPIWQYVLTLRCALRSPKSLLRRSAGESWKKTCADAW